MRSLAGALLAVGLAFGASGASAATLMGNSIDAAYYFPDSGTVYPFGTASLNPFTVGAGVDTTIDVEGVTSLLIDFSATSLVITLQTILTNPTWNAAAQNGPAFRVLSGNPFPEIDSVVASNAGPVTAFLLGGDLFVNWAGIPFTSGDTVTIEFVPIPLPASIVVLGFGLGVIGWVGHRRREA